MTPTEPEEAEGTVHPEDIQQEPENHTEGGTEEAEGGDE